MTVIISEKLMKEVRVTMNHGELKVEKYIKFREQEKKNSEVCRIIKNHTQSSLAIERNLILSI